MRQAIGILSLMAGLWAVAALYFAHAPGWVYPGPVLVALAPLALLQSRILPVRSPEERKRVARLVGLSTTFEGVAIAVGVNLAIHLGRPDLIASVTAALVGLHFFPLARWMPAPIYYLTGAALLIAAAAGVVLPDGGETVVAGAASAILWITALALVLGLPRAAVQQSRSS